ncbi:MAG: hypothetical protein JWR44_2318 [Hymenobacter sp.]|jgi:hypothetical protein|nr:hypothetical protein [Hymenobacter sp.]
MGQSLAAEWWCNRVVVLNLLLPVPHQVIARLKKESCAVPAPSFDYRPVLPAFPGNL